MKIIILHLLAQVICAGGDLQGIYSNLKDLEVQYSQNERILVDLVNHVRGLEDRGHKRDVYFKGFTKRISKLEERSTIISEQADTGFTAVQLTNEATRYDNESVIIFNQVLYDGSGNYNPDTGEYTCPYDGMYVFSASMLGYPREGITFCIQNRPGSQGLEACTHANNAGGKHVGTVTFVVPCSNGHKVTVRSQYDGSFTYGNYRGVTTASFSGVMIAVSEV